jgi:Type IV secretion system pilin
MSHAGTAVWIIGILVGLATLFLTIGGVRYLMAGRDPGEVGKAKTALKSAAIGYGLAILAPDHRDRAEVPGRRMTRLPRPPATAGSTACGQGGRPCSRWRWPAPPSPWPARPPGRPRPPAAPAPR